MANVLQLFIMHYKRESAKSYPKRHMGYYGSDDVAFVSQFVARDNGSGESLQV